MTAAAGPLESASSAHSAKPDRTIQHGRTYRQYASILLPQYFVPGDFWTVSNPFNEEDGPQPPKVLTAPLEVFANLRLLQQSHDPLIITFKDRNQRFQSYLVEVNRERGIVAFDELVPNDGERFFAAGETFRIEAMHDGVRIAWECEDPVSIGDLQGARCYWSHMPERITYHQRRNAFRAHLSTGQQLSIELSGSKLTPAIKGQLLDISATGCRLRFQGNITSRLQPGQVYEGLRIQLPFGVITTSGELRHLYFDEKTNMSFVGMR